jgi:hypothetical protein
VIQLVRLADHGWPEQTAAVLVLLASRCMCQTEVVPTVV